MSEINRLQMELNRREDENADDVAGSLKRLIATLEKENSSLKVDNFMFQYCHTFLMKICVSSYCPLIKSTLTFTHCI